MAITKETLRLVAQMRARVNQLAAGPTRSLTSAWIRAWDVLAAEFTHALDEILAIDAEHWPTRSQIERAARAQYALAMAQRALDRLAGQARDEIAAAAKAGIRIGFDGQEPLIASQLPDGARIQFRTVPENQVAAVVNRTAQQIHAVTWPLSSSAVEAMKSELIRGMAMGRNPRTIAAQMLARLEGAFNGGLARALNIARTEILDGFRSAAALSQAANADVLRGWVWHAELTRRTCASCWAMHGSEHPLDEPGPSDHQSGRCSRTPLTKSWKELGFDIPEPPSIIPDAKATFAALPHADQVAVMGPGRLAALNNGDIGWGDMSQLRTTPGWRDSYGVRPLADALAA